MMFGLVGWLAKSALMQSPIGTFLKMIPGKVWLVLAVLAALYGGYAYHQHAARKALRTADATGYARAVDDYRRKLAKEHADAVKWKDEADRLHGQISQAIREKNDAENRRIDAVAADLLRGGPGKARCRQGDNPGLPAASGGLGPSGGAGNAATAPMPADDRAAVPWPWLVNSAREADLNRAEVLAWREWYQRQAKAWPHSDKR